MFLILLIACIASHAKKYKALPSLVIEQKDGTVKKFEDDIFNLESQCKCIIEIKENLLCIYYSSDKETSWREDKEVVPETFYIEFKKSYLEGRLHFSGNDHKGKCVDGYLDQLNKSGSLCIYNTKGIDLYLVFEYALAD
ncbi:MAG: hypothetical protein J5817_08730 [Treponema sp.]|nr:hypothetical protein [Treponema sp.]